MLQHCKIDSALALGIIIGSQCIRHCDIFLGGRLDLFWLIRVRITCLVSINLHLNGIVLFLVCRGATEICTIKGHSHDLHLTRLRSLPVRAIDLESSHDRGSVDHPLSVGGQERCLRGQIRKDHPGHDRRAGDQWVTLIFQSLSLLGQLVELMSRYYLFLLFFDLYRGEPLVHHCLFGSYSLRRILLEELLNKILGWC